MAGLFITRAADKGKADAALDTARQQFAEHGFANETALAIPGWKALHWPYRSGGPAMLHTEGEDFVAVAGTFLFDGLMGPAALIAFLAAVALPAVLDWNRIGGHFACLVRKNGRTFVFTDYFSAFQLFHDTDRNFYSTSFVAAAKSLPNPRFDPQGVYEFAFNVVPLGNDTVFDGLKTLSPYHIIELTKDGAKVHEVEKPLPSQPTDMSLDERIARHSGQLRSIVGAHIREFGDNVNCPLSGGLDSRLVLGLLRDAGCTPRIYVYGDDEGEDVVVAKRIGKVEGFAVEYIDKGRPAPTPEKFAEQVELNFNRFDGIPTYGNIFDEGGFGEAMVDRHANGALAASGGCGEIYRDFFFLRNKAASAMTVAKTFFSRFAVSDATAGFDARDFMERIAGKIADEADAPNTNVKIDRQRIEQIYPRVRCRAFFGREISLESQFGAYMMPFLDHNVVAEAMTLPLSLKYAGRFESALLNAIDPALARHMSAYGHDFSGAPGLAHRAGEWSTRLRPTWVRANAYAVKRRMGPMADDHGGLLEPEYMGRVINLDFPVMKRFFNMSGMNDSGLWRRIACLEYLAGRVGIAA